MRHFALLEKDSCIFLIEKQLSFLKFKLDFQNSKYICFKNRLRLCIQSFINLLDILKKITPQKLFGITDLRPILNISIIWRPFWPTCSMNFAMIWVSFFVFFLGLQNRFPIAMRLEPYFLRKIEKTIFLKKKFLVFYFSIFYFRIFCKFSFEIW